MALGPIGQIHISVTDIDTSVAFYRDVLGIPLLFQVPEHADGVLCQRRCAAVSWACRKTPSFAARSCSTSRWPTSMLSTSGCGTSTGLSFTGEPHVVHRDANGELWMTFTRDPDDHWIGLMQQRAPAAVT